MAVGMELAGEAGAKLCLLKPFPKHNTTRFQHVSSRNRLSPCISINNLKTEGIRTNKRSFETSAMGRIGGISDFHKKAGDPGSDEENEYYAGGSNRRYAGSTKPPCARATLPRV